MSSKVTSKQKWLTALSIATCISSLSIAITYSGIFQSFELFALDVWFRLRPQEAKEKRIVVVTIEESDIEQLGHWPMSDRILNQLITKIARHKPRAIGLDIYRDVPVAPGTSELEAVFRSTSNLIGIEKAIGEKTKPSPILKQQDRVALADLVKDADAKIRRGLLSIELDNGTVQYGLAIRLALMYLATEEIEPLVNSEGDVVLGKTKIEPFQSNDGGYVRADDGGFQVLLNYRGTQSNFDRISLTDVLNDRIPEDLLRDRLILIGATAHSLNDFFATPYSRDRENQRQDMSGVFIHANIASQIISGALDGRDPIQTVGEPWEWLWILVWTSSLCSIRVFVSDKFLAKQPLFIANSTAVFLIVPALAILSSGYLLFLNSIWLPIISPLFSLTASSITINWYYQQNREKLQKNLAFIDSLTEIPNRRYFDEFLEEQWWQNQKKQQSLSIILGDVDFFKKYNDTYGHRAGDLCLQQVARVLAQSIRNGDLAARYGGEEFVVVLPNTSPEGAIAIAKSIGDRLKSFKIPHASSQVSEYVSFSCGVASTSISLVNSPEELVECADRALYLAKEQGRDRAVLWKKNLE